MGLDARLEELIRIESNRAVRRGALLALAIAVVAFALAFGSGLARHELGLRWVVPAAYGAVALAVWVLARRGLLAGGTAWGIFLGATALPPAYALLCEVLLPFGAATYLFAPMTWSYFLICIVSAFMLDARLSRAVGVASAAGYLVCWGLLARGHLAALPPLDPAFAEDLTGAAVHVLRATLILGAGVLAGALCTVARGVLERVRDEEREKASISRLFGEYVSPEVKDKLIREMTTLKGERREVAVLFSDLRSFTTFSEGKEPAEVVARLNQYFDRMVSAISKHHGTVDKFIGDAVMATFGGLLPVDNPALAALEASREMRRALAELNREWASQGLSPLENGIGLHYGNVLQGPIGSATRKEFTVIGDVVNTASRLESVTKELGHPVVLSRSTYEALPPAAREGLTSLGEVALKGKKDPLAVWGTGA